MTNMSKIFSKNENFDESSDVIIFNEDCLTALAQIPDNSCQLVISSPPYNIGKVYEKRQDFEAYLEWQKSVLKECKRVLKDNGSLVWQVGNYIENGESFPLDIYFYPIVKQLDFKLRNRIVWHFNHGLHAKNRLSGRYETVLWFTKTDDYTFNLDPIRVPSKYPGKRHYKGDKKGQLSGNPLGKNPSDYWEIIANEFDAGIIDMPNVKSNHVEKTIHPCQFPVALVERFVLSLTDTNDLVLDPFSGVGSTAIASLLHNRRTILVDKEKEYIDLSLERIESLENGTLKIRPLDKPIHKPSKKDKVSSYPEEWKNQTQLELKTTL